MCRSAPSDIPPVAFNKPPGYATGRPETPQVQIVPPFLDFNDRFALLFFLPFYLPVALYRFLRVGNSIVDFNFALYQFIPFSPKDLFPPTAALQIRGPFSLPSGLILSRSISIPAVELIDIGNTHESEDLHILGVTTDSMSFHSSFLKRVIVPPKSNMSMSVVFLPRNLGHVENSLVISTNVGTFIYQVAGRGIACPYRIQPLVGVKVPVNTHYEPSISIYNPHSTVLRVREIFTSGGFLHLTLPAVDPESAQSNMSAGIKLWDIPPKGTRTLINLDFSSATAGKYQGFVNIKTNVENMILHVEVVVVKGGIHRTPEELDFGTITSMHERRALDLSLLNGGSSAIQVIDLQSAAPDPQLQVEFAPKNISAKSESVVATISFSAVSPGPLQAPTSAALSNGNSNTNKNANTQSQASQQAAQQAPQGNEYRTGKLLLRTNDSNPVNSRIEIPYRVRVLQGGLGYQPAHATFPATRPGTNTSRDLVLTSKFSVPLLVYSVEIEHAAFVLISDKIQPVGNATASRAVLVEPGATLPVLKIIFVNPPLPQGSSLIPPFFTTFLTLNTNASAMSIPLVVYAGTLDVLAPRGGEADALAFTASADQMDNVREKGINFGVVGLEEIKMKTLNITNRNPVPVSIQSITASLDGLAAKLEGIWNNFGYMSHTGRDLGRLEPAISKTDSSTKKSPRRATSSSASTLFSLDPGHSAIMSLELSAREEKEVDGILKITTPYEDLSVKVVYQSLGGALDLWPLTIRFDDHEDAITSHKKLTLKNGFSRPVGITSAEVADARLRVEIISPKMRLSAGTAFESVSVSTSESARFVVGPSQSWPELASFVPPLTSQSQSAEFAAPPQAATAAVKSSLPLMQASEISRLQKIAEQWRAYPNGLSEIRSILTLKTDLAVVSRFPISVVWPFPTLLGKEISVRRFGFGAEQPLKSSRSLYLRLENPLQHQSVLAQLLVSAEDAIDGITAPSTTEIVLPPGGKAEIGPIVIDPSHIHAIPAPGEDHLALPLYIRNNLTVLETVHVEFRVAKASLVLAPHVEDQSQPLDPSAPRSIILPLNSSQLETYGCCCASAFAHLKLVNLGNVALDVDRVGIVGAGGTASAGLAVAWGFLFAPVRSPFSSLLCEGFGFTVASPLCSASGASARRIEPMGSIEVNITYVPDFSAARVSREFIVETFGNGEFKFVLEASLPEESISACLEALESEGVSLSEQVVESKRESTIVLPSTVPPPFLADYLFQGYPGSVTMRPVVVVLGVAALLALLVIALKDFSSFSGDSSSGAKCPVPVAMNYSEDQNHFAQNGGEHGKQNGRVDLEAPAQPLPSADPLITAALVVEGPSPSEPPTPGKAEPVPNPKDTPAPVAPTISKKQQKKAARAAAAAAAAAALPVVVPTPPPAPAEVVAPVQLPVQAAVPADPAPRFTPDAKLAPAPEPAVSAVPAVKPAKAREEKKSTPAASKKPEKELRPDKVPTTSPAPKFEEKKPGFASKPHPAPTAATGNPPTPVHPLPTPVPAKTDFKIMKRETKESEKAPTAPAPAPPSLQGPVSILKKDPTKLPAKETLAPANPKSPPSPTKSTSNPIISKPGKNGNRKETSLVEPVTLLKKPTATTAPVTAGAPPAASAKSNWAGPAAPHALKYVAVDPEKKKQRLLQQQQQQKHPSASSQSSSSSSSPLYSPPLSTNASQIYATAPAAVDADPAALVEQLVLLHQQQQQESSSTDPATTTAAEIATALQALETLNNRDGQPQVYPARGAPRGRPNSRGGFDRRGRGAYHQQPQGIYKRKVAPTEADAVAAPVRGKGASWPNLPQVDNAPPQPSVTAPQHYSMPSSSTPVSISAFPEFYAPSPYSSTPAATPMSHADITDHSSGLYGIDDFAASLYNPYGQPATTLNSLLAGPPRSGSSLGPVGIIGSGMPAASRVAAIWERLPGVNSSGALAPPGAGLHGPIPMTPAIGTAIEDDGEYYADDAELEAAVPGAFVDDDDSYYDGMRNPLSGSQSSAPFSMYPSQELPSSAESPRSAESYSSLFSSLPFFSGKSFFTPLFSSAESASEVEPTTSPVAPSSADSEESSLFSGSTFIPPTMAVSAAAIRRASVGSASSRPRSNNSSFSDLDNAVDDTSSNGSYDD